MAELSVCVSAQKLRAFGGCFMIRPLGGEQPAHTALQSAAPLKISEVAMAGGWFDLSGLLGYQRAPRIVGKPRRPPTGSYKAALTKLSRRGGGAEAARRTTGARRPAAMHCQARSTPPPLSLGYFIIRLLFTRKVSRKQHCWPQLQLAHYPLTVGFN